MEICAAKKKCKSCTVNNYLHTKKEFDAVVVGAGPNGLAAAITLQQAGLSVVLLEVGATVGGGLRSAAITIPGFIHDYCSAVHPLAAASPFFQSIPLQDFGLNYCHPEIALAHPFDDGTAVTLLHSIDAMADSLGEDEGAYKNLVKPLVKSWPVIDKEILGPVHFYKHAFEMAAFGMKALSSINKLSKIFKTEKARGFWAGLGMHAQLPFEQMATSGIGLVLLTAGHMRGWPVVQGGSQSLADALAGYFKSLGGKIELNLNVRSLNQIPSSHAVLLDVGPAQLLAIAGHRLSSFYRWQLSRFRYGMGVFKVDWALSEQVPFTAPSARKAGTVHLGGSFAEIADWESAVWAGKYSEQPAVLLSQQSLADPTRAPEGRQTGWAYCHVPSGSTKNMTTAIESQVERFAPGFRDTILARHVMNTEDLELHNANNVGGDIAGGANIISQLFTRPALRASPYRSSTKGIYLCSASTPPGGGVHGMCGFHAAQRVLKDMFNDRII
jgi:phytoene dehydrogenase-like protein